MLKSRCCLERAFLLLSFFIAGFSSSLSSMEPLPGDQVGVPSRSSLSSPLESTLRAIGGIVGDSGPTCFIARCYTGEDPRILEEQERINTCLRLMGIRTIFDVNGDEGGLPIGGDTLSYMEEGITNSDFVLCAFTTKGFERYKNRTSGYAVEVRHILRRLECATSDEEKKFLIPVLMTGTKNTSVPIELEYLLFINAVEPSSSRFDLNIFFREMWPLFEERFFRKHPRVREIQICLRQARSGQEEVQRVALASSAKSHPEVLQTLPSSAADRELLPARTTLLEALLRNPAPYVIGPKPFLGKEGVERLEQPIPVPPEVDLFLGKPKADSTPVRIDEVTQQVIDMLSSTSSSIV